MSLSKMNGDTDVDMSNCSTSDHTHEGLRGKYQSILQEFWSKEAAQEFQDGDQLKEAMSQADSLFLQISNPQEALLDAKLLGQISSASRHMAENLSTSTEKFVPMEFAGKLIDTLGGTTDDNSDVAILSADHWAALGEQSFSLFHDAHHLEYMFGSMDNTEYEKKTRARSKRPAAGPVGNVTRALVLSQEDDEPSQSGGKKTLTERLVESTLVQLKDLYATNRRRPLCYFTFVIDPDNFGKTVENMFHVSFLVKEGRAEIFIDDNGLPKILPSKHNKDSEHASHKKQVVMSITFQQWKALRDCLKITEPQICHKKVLKQS